MTGPGGVLLLHGHSRFGGSMARLAGTARRAGHTTFAPSYPYRRSLAQVTAWLEPRIVAFEASLSGPLHIVSHSFGSLVSRALLAVWRPRWLGRVVMLAPPHAGSELADLLLRLRIGSLVLGRSISHLGTIRTAGDEATLGTVDYPLGVIAGDRSLLPLPFALLTRPHDGKVSVASTRGMGLSDHIVLPVTHSLMIYNRSVVAATMRFLETGTFATIQAAD